jgi:hypothetical protein
MVKRSYRDLFGISRKWLGLYLEIFLGFGVLFGNFVGHGLISCKRRGFSPNVAGLFWFQIYFSIGNRMDRVHGLLTAQGRLVHGCTADSTVADSQGSPELGLAAAPGNGNLPRLGENGEGDAAQPGSSSPEHGRC